MVLYTPFLPEARPSVLNAAIFGEPELEEKMQTGQTGEEEQVRPTLGNYYLYIHCCFFVKSSETTHSLNSITFKTKTFLDL